MVAPNEQDFVNGKLIVVTLIEGKQEASITVGEPGSPTPPALVSIKPYLDAGLTEREALRQVLNIAAISVRGATS